MISNKGNFIWAEQYNDRLTVSFGLVEFREVVTVDVRKNFWVKNPTELYEVTINWSALGSVDVEKAARFNAALYLATGIASEIKDRLSDCPTDEDIKTKFLPFLKEVAARYGSRMEGSSLEEKGG
jgi:hypothetical protein